MLDMRLIYEELELEGVRVIREVRYLYGGS